MKKLNRLLYSNKLFALIMLLLQVTAFVFMYIWISDYSNVLIGFTTVFSAVLIIIEVNRESEPTFQMTWVMLIAIFPVFGGLFYLFMRMRMVAWNIKDDYDNIHEANMLYLEKDPELEKRLDTMDRRESDFVRYLEKYGGSPAYEETTVQYFPSGRRMFDDMKRELMRAEKFIFMEFFIINTTSRMWSEILEILRAKAKQGVEVRVLYDAMGCITTMPRHYDEYLGRLGIKARIFSPIVPLISTHQNNRDHRKILVVDGECAFSGGINIADEYIGEKMRFKSTKPYFTPVW